MKQNNYLFVFLVLALTTFHVYAIPPATPVLELKQQGLFIEANWNVDPTVVGYTLYYATYPDMEQIGSVDLGNTNYMSAELENGTAMFVAVLAYNAQGEMSEISNIEHFNIDNKVLVFISSSELSQQLLAGLNEAFEGVTEARLEPMVIDSANTRSDLFFGNEDAYVATPSRGYIDDPNVVAVVTTTTDSTLELTKRNHENPPLIIAMTATTTLLNTLDNVITIAPQNDVQGDTLFGEFLVASNEKMLCYAVLVNTQASHDLYSHDLYLQLLESSLPFETPIQDSNGLTLDTKEVVPFPQLCGTLMFDGNPDNVPHILQQLDTLNAEAVLYVGATQHLKTFYDQRPDLMWFASDGDYKYEDFKGGDVTILTFGGDIYDYGYDTGGFLKETFASLSSKLLNRSDILKAAKEIYYEGRTGNKSFFDVDNPGWYDVWMPGEIDWEKLPPVIIEDFSGQGL